MPLRYTRHLSGAPVGTAHHVDQDGERSRVSGGSKIDKPARELAEESEVMRETGVAARYAAKDFDVRLSPTP